jgi:hypothetical protein
MWDASEQAPGEKYNCMTCDSIGFSKIVRQWDELR